MWRFSAQDHELRAIWWFRAAFLRTGPLMLVGTEPGHDALIHTPQKSTIHRFLMVRTIGPVVMKLLA